MLTKSIRAVVAVERSQPYFARVRPDYIPRKQLVRKAWTTYSSIQGTFHKGALAGVCVIRYVDGAFYEGPYIAEDWLDEKGFLVKGARARNHYGVYKCPDGRIFEGSNVDNHFDPLNVQDYYRLTLPNGEVYEGGFCDEYYHGIGQFKYKDGSVYEGEFFKGLRFGHGQLRSSEGWTYEGNFDSNRRHGDGVCTWPDGSCYMGEWQFDERTGYGIFLTPLRDLFRGTFENGKYMGPGELLYANGARYTGEFKDGWRHGRGVYTDSVGNEYYGHFVNDEKEGEMVVKVIINIEAKGQDNYEIRIGVYDHGNFVNWKLKFFHPIITREFIKMFKSRESFDSVYSMMVTKNLPNLPDGVDGNNEAVQDIIVRLRNTAGSLVNQNSLIQAREKLEKVLKPLRDARHELDELTANIDRWQLRLIGLDTEQQEAHDKYISLIKAVEMENEKIEQFWLDDPLSRRKSFLAAVAEVSKISKDDYFEFRNHRTPPPFVKKICDAMRYALVAHYSLLVTFFSRKREHYLYFCGLQKKKCVYDIKNIFSGG